MAPTIERIETNLGVILAEIGSILKKWGQRSAKLMIERTERGDLPEAEVEAIALANLLDKRTQLEEVIRFKLQHLQGAIRSILVKGKEENVEDFVQKARTGEIPEAEMDAITIRQLVKDQTKLQDLLSNVDSEEKS